MGNAGTVVVATRDRLPGAVADYVTGLAARALAERHAWSIALSGGTALTVLADGLSEYECAQVDWSAWRIFWVDERCVPLTHAQSNFRAAQDALLSRVPIPASQVFPVTDPVRPAAAAEAYERTLACTFQPAPGDIPRFDLILLGVGDDGHTASLFPASPALTESVRWVTAVTDAPKPPPHRITLTLPVLNNARHVAFVATGRQKAPILSKAMRRTPSVPPLPAQLVRPGCGELVWFIDSAASGQPC